MTTLNAIIVILDIILTRIFFENVISLCFTCSAAGTSLYNNCNICKTGYYKVQKGNTFNCYTRCPGLVSESSCNSVIYFTNLSDTIAKTNLTITQILDGMDNYIFGFYEISPTIVGSGFIINLYLLE